MSCIDSLVWWLCDLLSLIPCESSRMTKQYFRKKILLAIRRLNAYKVYMDCLIVSVIFYARLSCPRSFDTRLEIRPQTYGHTWVPSRSIWARPCRGCSRWASPGLRGSSLYYTCTAQWSPRCSVNPSTACVHVLQSLGPDTASLNTHISTNHSVNIPRSQRL